MDFKRYVNEIYLQEHVLREMRRSFSSSGVLKLEGFLKEEVFRELMKLLGDVRGEHVKVPNRYSYDEIRSLSWMERLFTSGEMIQFVRYLANGDFEEVALGMRGFGQGDYTLLYDSDSRAGTDFFFIFCDAWEDAWGGQMIYTENTEGGKTLVFPIVGNSFVVVRENEMGYFIKYVNHLAGKKRFILIKGRLK